MPSCPVIGRYGRVRLHHFGELDDQMLGGLPVRLIASLDGPDDGVETQGLDAPCGAESHAVGCEPSGCTRPIGGHAGAGALGWPRKA